MKIPRAAPRSKRRYNIKITLDDTGGGGGAGGQDRLQSRSPANVIKHFVLHKMLLLGQLGNY